MKTHANDSHTTRIALLEQSIAHINETLQDIRGDLKEVRNKIDSNFKWVMGAIVLGILAPIALQAIKLFHT